MFDENWAMIAEKDGEVVGAALTLPDINQVLAKLKGRLLPLRLAGTSSASAGDRPAAGRFALGVKHDYQHTGVAAGLYLKHLEAAARTPQIAAARWAGSSRRTSR